jgi:hypothetical protein
MSAQDQQSALRGASVCVVAVPAFAGLQASPDLTRACTALGTAPPSLPPLAPGCFALRAELRAAPPALALGAVALPLPERGLLLAESRNVTVQVEEVATFRDR